MLSPYLNFHRPCPFVTLVADKDSKVRKVYREDGVATPNLAKAEREFIGIDSTPSPRLLPRASAMLSSKVAVSSRPHSQLENLPIGLPLASGQNGVSDLSGHSVLCPAGQREAPSLLFQTASP